MPPARDGSIVAVISGNVAKFQLNFRLVMGFRAAASKIVPNNTSQTSLDSQA